MPMYTSIQNSAYHFQKFTDPWKPIFFGHQGPSCMNVNCAEKFTELHTLQIWEVTGVNCVSKNSTGNLAAWEQVVNPEVSGHHFFGNLSHWADWRLLAQVGVTWPECCTLTNQVLGEADGTSCQTLATSTNNQTLHSIVSGDTPCLMYSTNWKSNN